MGKLNVFLAVPHNGQMHPLTAAALAFASQRQDDHPTIGFHFEAASLLGFCFNRLWCEARNLQAQGEPITHFAMLHSDVAPDPGWLDILLDLQQQLGADVVSAVVPIKDPRGITSTAILGPKGNVLRRLTMHEVFRLPETFTARDVSEKVINPRNQLGYHGAFAREHPLLVNTGCWICDFTRPWVKHFPGFHIDDWIANEDDGTCQPGVFSEDWNASRWWHRHDLKVHATRKIRLSHYGQFGFQNSQAWGDWLTDLSDASMKRAEGIEGWMTEAELHWLRARAAECQMVVEIGSWRGRSTHALAETCPGLVVAVDHFQGNPGPDIAKEMKEADLGEVRADFHKNLNGYMISGKVRLIEGTSEEAARKFERERERPDMVFIDGDHRYESVVADIRRWKPLVRPGGLLCGHDSDEYGVRRAIEELLPGWQPGPVRLWQYEVT